MASTREHLFVYGTLRSGQSPFVSRDYSVADNCAGDGDAEPSFPADESHP